MDNQAFDLNGSTAYVQIPNSPVLCPTNLTVEAWVNFSSLDSSGNAQAGEQFIVFKQNSRTGNFEGFFLGKVRGGGGDYFAFGVTSAAGASAQADSAPMIQPGVWYHVAGVRGTDFLQLYVNGQLVNQASVDFPQDYGNTPLYFGTSGVTYWDGKFAGLLDEVSLYNRALSAAEIAAIYQASSAGKCRAPGQIIITSQPLSQSVAAGSSVQLNVTAIGGAPLSYQWYLDGRAIPGTTSSSLSLSNVQPADQGDYTAVVSNTTASQTSAVAVLTVIVPGTSVSAPAGLIGWWPGDGGANDIFSTNNGTLHGNATANALGVVGTGFLLDGTNSFVSIPDSLALHPANLTIEAWVRCDSLDTPAIGSYPGQQYIVFHQNAQMANFEGFDLAKDREPRFIGTNDTWCFEVTSTSGNNVFVESVTLVETNVWYHIAGVRGSDYIQLYVNGKLEGQTSVDFPVGYGNFPLYFGTTGQPFWDHKFAGALDEVSLYDRALSAGEIAAIYAAGKLGKCKPPTIVSIGLSQLSPELTIAGVAGQTYGIQVSSSLLGATNHWVGLTNVILQAPTSVWRDPSPISGPQRFYRVVWGIIPIP